MEEEWLILYVSEFSKEQIHFYLEWSKYTFTWYKFMSIIVSCACYYLLIQISTWEALVIRYV